MVVSSKRGKRIKEPYGVGGWLFFFVFVLSLNSLLLIRDIFQSFQLIFSSVYVPSITVLFCLALLFEIFIIGVFLLSLDDIIKHRISGIKRLKWGLWMPVVLHAFVFIIIATSGVDAETLGNKIDIISPLIFALIWTSYLKQSIRVKNTFS